MILITMNVRHSLRDPNIFAPLRLVQRRKPHPLVDYQFDGRPTIAVDWKIVCI